MEKSSSIGDAHGGVTTAAAATDLATDNTGRQSPSEECSRSAQIHLLESDQENSMNKEQLLCAWNRVPKLKSNPSMVTSDNK